LFFFFSYSLFSLFPDLLKVHHRHEKKALGGSLIMPVGLLAFWRVSLLASFGVTRLSPYAALVTFDAHMFV